MTRTVYWKGRKVLITGGSSGIGRQVAQDLLRLGAHVGIVSHDSDRLRTAELELKRISPHVWSHACDISVLEDIRTMAREYRAQFDAPDVLVNNAGYAVYETFERMSLEEIRRLFDVNLAGAAFVTREFLPDMIRAGGGDVVMVSSIAGRVPVTPCSVYGASKHGMISLAELVNIETARFNVRVQVVCPGRVQTDFFSHESFRRRAHRPETGYVVPIEVVTRAITAAVERNRFLTYVPRHYGLVAWCTAAFPVLFRPLWRRLLTSRVDSYYDDESSRTEPQ